MLGAALSKASNFFINYTIVNGFIYVPMRFLIPTLNPVMTLLRLCHVLPSVCPYCWPSTLFARGAHLARHASTSLASLLCGWFEHAGISQRDESIPDCGVPSTAQLLRVLRATRSACQAGGGGARLQHPHGPRAGRSDDANPSGRTRICGGLTAHFTLCPLVVCCFLADVALLYSLCL